MAQKGEEATEQLCDLVSTAQGKNEGQEEPQEDEWRLEERAEHHTSDPLTENVGWPRVVVKMFTVPASLWSGRVEFVRREWGYR